MVVVKRHRRGRNIVRAHKRRVKRKVKLGYYIYDQVWHPKRKTWITLKRSLGTSGRG